MEAWVRMDEGGSSWQTLASKPGQYRLHVNLDCFHFSVGGATAGTPRPEVTIRKDVWYHVVGTYDGKEIRVYIDGSLQTHAPCPGPIPRGEETLYLGAQPVGNVEPLVGTLDEVRIYPRALTPEEVRQSFNGR